MVPRLTTAPGSVRGVNEDSTVGSDSGDAGDSAVAPATRVAAVIVDALVEAGVRDAVVCPGSRSAPLALALAEASRTGRLRLHVRIDERSGSFLALGLARRSYRPVPIVMTSGTAVANCLPAMVEATASGVPLMVLSANRPWEMLGTGANQTIEQKGIFGSHAVATIGIDAAVAATAAAADTAVRGAVAEAVAATARGGVQVDVPFAPPLVPQTADEVTLAARAAQEEALQDATTTTTAATAASSPDADPATTRTDLPTLTVDLSRRTLVIAGEVRDRAWADRIFDALAGVPTIAEPLAPAPDTPVHPAAAGLLTSADGVTADVTAGHGGNQAHNDYRATVRPEQIVLVGRTTLHRGVTALLSDPAIDILAVTDRDTAPQVNSNQRDGRMVSVTGEHPRGWLKVCAAASEVATDTMRDLLAEPSNSFTGLHVAAAVTDSLADGDALVLGASSPVRDASLAGLPFPGVTAIANRGASGIDGTVSTAVGVALAHASAEPDLVRAPRTVALLGDLTFLHDINGLEFGPAEPRPDNLVIVVANDDGGAIFETLETGRDALRTFADGTDVFDRVFATPTAANLRALCEGYGVEHHRVETLEELRLELENHAEGTGGMLVIEAVVSRGPRARIHAELAARTTLGATDSRGTPGSAG